MARTLSLKADIEDAVTRALAGGEWLGEREIALATKVDADLVYRALVRLHQRFEVDHQVKRLKEKDAYGLHLYAVTWRLMSPSESDAARAAQRERLKGIRTSYG